MGKKLSQLNAELMVDEEFRREYESLVEIDLEKPTPFASGKTLVVASTRGNAVTTAEVDGKLRHWERGDRRPHGPALVLLNALAKEPGTVLRILTGKRESNEMSGGMEKAA